MPGTYQPPHVFRRIAGESVLSPWLETILDELSQAGALLLTDANKTVLSHSTGAGLGSLLGYETGGAKGAAEDALVGAIAGPVLRTPAARIAIARLVRSGMSEVMAHVSKPTRQSRRPAMTKKRRLVLANYTGDPKATLEDSLIKAGYSARRARITAIETSQR